MFALLLLAAALAAAQPTNQPTNLPANQPAEGESEFTGAPSERVMVDSGKPVTQEEAQAAIPGMELADARMNFETVVQSYVANHSHEKAWKALQLVRVEKESVEPVEGSQTVYSGRALMTAKGELIPVTFTVDFTGPSWAVTSVERPKAAAVAKKKKAKKKAAKR
jgi:hypothetical protein